MLKRIFFLLLLLASSSAFSQTVPLSNLLIITRDQFSSTVVGLNTVTLAGYHSIGDLGRGAIYTSVGATCPNGLGAVQDAHGRCFNLVITTLVNVGWFGAYADDGAHKISSADINANPQWRGTYTAGTTWDTVAVQESKYAAYAAASTPGNIVWNGNNSFLNVEWFLPNGQNNWYGINKQIVSVQSGFRDRAEGKATAVLDWIGPVGTIMWLCNSCSYGQEINLSVNNSQVQSYPNLVPLVSWDHTGSIPGLSTQQVTIYDMWCSLTWQGECMQISRTGGGAQGDTMTFINPFFGGFGSDYALNLGGDNTLSVVIVNGDCQGFWHDCINNNAGTILTYGTHFENQNDNFTSQTPIWNQFTTHGADVHSYAGVGNADSILHGARAEDSVLTAGFAGITNIHDGAVLGVDLSFGHFASTGYLPGQATTPTTSNTKNRAFMVVEDGGNATWNAVTGTAGQVLTDSGASYTVNQWAGYNLYYRFADANADMGFTIACVIASNTVNTITVNATGSCASGLPVLQTGALYHIGGISGGSDPNWDSAATGFMNNSESTNSGFYTVSGSAVVSMDGTTYNQISVNDYLVIPFGDKIAPFGAPVVAQALIAKVLSKTTVGCPFDGFCVTLNKNAAFTLGDTIHGIGAFGYYGTPITDNQIKWIDLEFDVAQAADVINQFQIFNSGKIGPSGNKYGAITGVRAARLDWLDATYNAGGISALSSGIVFTNMTQGGTLNRFCQTLSTAATVDLTGSLSSCNEIPYTPTQSATLNAPLPNAMGAQAFDLLITTSGVSSFTITFGSNFSANGTLSTGTVSGALFTIRFISDGTTWREVWRSPIGSVSCAAGTVSTATLAVTSGLVTHC